MCFLFFIRLYLFIGFLRFGAERVCRLPGAAKQKSGIDFHEKSGREHGDKSLNNGNRDFRNEEQFGRSQEALVREEHAEGGEERRAKDRQNAAEETSGELYGFPLCEERSGCHAEKNGRKGHVHGIAAEHGEAAELEKNRLQKQADENGRESRPPEDEPYEAV